MSTTSFQRNALTDWPTVALIVIFWLAFGGLVLNAALLPAPIGLCGFAVLGCFYMSLQHEVIHGHPTRHLRLNWIVVGLPLGIVLPFARYRDSHLAHHSSDITNPVDDPESFYVLAETWYRAGSVRRQMLIANRTLAGRLVMAPLIMAWRTVAADAPRLSVGSIRRVWLRHLVGAALVLTLVHRSPTPMWVFVMGFVYFGSSLTALRSFAEHRASIVDPHPDTSRAAVVQSGWLFSLLFLNNNLHHTHHQLPGAAWFRLPELSRVIESATVAGAGVHPGYGSIARRYLFRPLDRPVHPMSDSMRA